MPIVLPLSPSEPNYSFSCTIRGQEISFDVRWNASDKIVDPVTKAVLVEGAWMLDWFDADGNVITRGMKIALGTNLGRGLAHPLFSRIVVRAVDTTGKGREAGFHDIGTRVVVRVYSITDEGAVE